jgi:microcystin-dependent protein
MGTTYGTGDGSTTFNLPDKTGRISAMKEATATRLTSTYFGGNSTNMGATGGSESQILTASQLPSNIPYSDPGHSHSEIYIQQGSGATYYAVSTAQSSSPATWPNTGTSTTGITINPSGGTPHINVQPTIICNYVIRII